MSRNTYLLGSKDFGCLVDNENAQLIYYEQKNFAEKVTKKDNASIVAYKDIEKIVIGFTSNYFKYGGLTHLILNVYQPNQEKPLKFKLIDFNTTTQSMREFVEVLLESGLVIEDEYAILPVILTSEEKIGTIIDQHVRMVNHILA